MILTRMNWAGIHVKGICNSIAIDPILRYDLDFFGKPRQEMFPLQDFPSVDAVFITHVHSDHFDPTSLVETYGSDVPVYVPNESKRNAIQYFQNVHGVNPGDVIQIGDLRVHVAPAVDGLGDPQVSYVVFADGIGVFHGGDTLWHGHWWSIARLGKIEVACLPVNGAEVQDPHMQPSNQPICMNPEQAISAAKILGVHKVIPIHFGTFHFPPYYSETPNVKTRLEQASSTESISICMLAPKEKLQIS